MLTVYGEGRGFRVVWLLEELGLAYRLRPVDLFAVENDRDFLAINPAGFIPVLQDGETIMVESIGILEYLLARHGSGSLAVAPDDPAFASYLQFLHLGEAGLAGPMNAVIVGRQLAPVAERDARVTRWARETFESPPPRGLPLSRRRPLHGCRYLGELRPAARPANRQLRPRSDRAGLSRPHDGTPCLPPSDGKLPGHQGLGGKITGIVVFRFNPAVAPGLQVYCLGRVLIERLAPDVRLAPISGGEADISRDRRKGL
ncbi:hypothetical protein ACVWY5_002961 [Bradyrhizobium sp. USDA 3256]